MFARGPARGSSHSHRWSHGRVPSLHGSEVPFLSIIAYAWRSLCFPCGKSLGRLGCGGGLCNRDEWESCACALYPYLHSGTPSFDPAKWCISLQALNDVRLSSFGGHLLHLRTP
ncbi:hypothetical protein M011DRAFT_190883 [Sporormia fimetaria CBS 119925]|uniref:Uncharacterized protein n=1 Tax=Sporormia fimetaria CBS 119925 TaxID=1340428 RepID=A0A6A6VMI8_9PLEO|nr:hypothetical protein M011DRAFT_190883 [Sporormia fimetaria CBS 119925]